MNSQQFTGLRCQLHASYPGLQRLEECCTRAKSFWAQRMEGSYVMVKRLSRWLSLTSALAGPSKGQKHL